MHAKCLEKKYQEIVKSKLKDEQHCFRPGCNNTEQIFALFFTIFVLKLRVGHSSLNLYDVFLSFWRFFLILIDFHQQCFCLIDTLNENNTINI